jgi:hypothetical protein
MRVGLQQVEHADLRSADPASPTRRALSDTGSNVTPMTDTELLTTVIGGVSATAELNEVSQPLGYAVTHTTRGVIGGTEHQSQRFTLHRLDKPVASGPSFSTTEDVRAALAEIAKLPRWRIELAENDSVVFDPAELTITDTASGESFCLRAGALV